MQHTDRIDVGACLCPECYIPIVLTRPTQAERFFCGVCGADLEVRGGYVVELGYGNSQRIHHLTGRK